MQSLNEIYNEIAKNGNRCSYYGKCYENICKDLSDNGKALKFIENFFSMAGKEKVFCNSLLQKNKEKIEDRAPHIISTYLLGIKIAEVFDLKDKDCYGNMNFLYRWFLACLYHDVGYIYENKYCCEDLRALQIDGLEAIQEICNIRYLHNREFKTYSKKQVDVYLKGRAKCKNGKMGVIDHGIAGGLMLYDGLRKNFEVAWKKCTNLNKSREEFFFENNDVLRFSNADYEEYAKAADAIIAHNIFVDTLNSYIRNNDEYGEEKHIGKIGVDNQTCFILSLADTIEPIKRFNQIDIDTVLDSIFIDTVDHCIRIQINISQLNQNENDCSNYVNSIESLREWVNVQVTVEQNDSNSNIEIRIKE